MEITVITGNSDDKQLRTDQVDQITGAVPSRTNTLDRYSATGLVVRGGDDEVGVYQIEIVIAQGITIRIGPLQAYGHRFVVDDPVSRAATIVEYVGHSSAVPERDIVSSNEVALPYARRHGVHVAVIAGCREIDATVGDGRIDSLRNNAVLKNGVPDVTDIINDDVGAGFTCASMLAAN